MRCAEPVQSVTVSPIGDFVYIGGNFTFIDDTPVATTPFGTYVLLLSLNVSESSIRPEHFIMPHKFHRFRIDGPAFPPEQAWQISGAFGILGIAVAEQISMAGLKGRIVDGLVRFSVIE